jgi:hypothetical protein
MPAVRLPADTYYISVDKTVLSGSMGKIEEHFRDLLENGAQAVGVPSGRYAAGKYLNPHSINQRGIYGTSAALLVLARSAPSEGRISFIEGIIKYVIDRPEIERSLADSDASLSAVTARLAIEWNTAFKCAELLYALSAAPAAVTGREELINEVLTRIKNGSRVSGGWAVDLDPQRDIDPLATASIVRAVSAAGIANEEINIKLIREYAHNDRNVSTYVRVFCLLVLLEIGGRDLELDEVWKKIFEELAPQLRERTEANYEFTLGSHYHSVRVPWQLYLLSCAALRGPVSIVFNQHIRRVLLDGISALNSPQGYIYASSGHMKSTRTYSILMDTLWRLNQALATSRYVTPISMLANIGVRIAYSRTVTWLALLGALVIGGYSLWSWIYDEKVALSAVGPELFSAGMLAAVAVLLRQVRRR